MPTDSTPDPMRCTYCKAECSGTYRDTYGEWRMKRPMPICAECKQEFENEPGPWNEVR